MFVDGNMQHDDTTVGILRKFTNENNIIDQNEH